MLLLLEPKSPLLPLTPGSSQDSKTTSRTTRQAGAQDLKEPGPWLRSQALTATRADGALHRGSLEGPLWCVLELAAKKETSPTGQASVWSGEQAPAGLPWF